MSYPAPPIRLLLVLLVAVAAFTDLRSRRVPNWLTFPAVGIGIGLNWFLFSTAGLIDSFEGMGLALLVYLPLYLLRGMGAGDVKLMAAIGSLAGVSNWFGIFILTAILGGVLGFVTVAVRGRLRRTFQNLWMILMSLRMGQTPYNADPQLDVTTEHGVRMPHAVPVAGGVLMFLIASAIWAPH